MSYDPFGLLSEFDRLFDEAYAARAGDNSGKQLQQARGPRTLRPRLDLHEDEKANTVTAVFELPGLKKEDVNISVQNNILTVSGETKKSEERDEDGYKVRERHYGKFSRSIQLPQGVKETDIKASLDNGLLTVTFPRTTPEQAPKKITIS
ncbi:HSP20-like chaperone [Panus rudis PR-1116 ss-1]|nr:HSP20-like chaperone [Panus rudis PR-1116 ss-1]